MRLLRVHPLDSPVVALAVDIDGQIRTMARGAYRRGDGEDHGVRRGRRVVDEDCGQRAGSGRMMR
jgi:hypothetical protein